MVINKRRFYWAALVTAAVCAIATSIIVPITDAMPWLSYSLDPGTSVHAEPDLDVCGQLDIGGASDHVRPVLADCDHVIYRLDGTVNRLAVQQGFGPAEHPLPGSHGPADRFIRPAFMPILRRTLARYRRVSGSPNLWFRELPRGNTLVATNMGLALYEVDPLGYAVWYRASGSHRNRAARWIFGDVPEDQEAEVYSSVEPSASLVVYTVTNKHKVVVFDRVRTQTVRDYSVESPRSARLTARGLLIAGGSPKGFVDLVDPPSGKVLWRFDRDLQSPREAVFTRSGLVAIADTFNHRVLLIDPATGQTIQSWRGFSFPGGLAETSTGVLFASSEHQNQVFRLRPDGSTEPVFPTNLLSAPAKIAAVGDHMLIADSGHHRVIEVDLAGNVVWELTNLNDPMGVSRQ